MKKHGIPRVDHFTLRRVYRRKIGRRTEEQNYQTSLAAFQREKKKDKKRVVIYVGEKVHSFAIQPGEDFRFEIVQGDDVISIHDWRCRRSI